MKIVLDTHIVLSAANETLAPSRTELLIDQNNNLFISAITLWEITKLFEYKRIELVGGLQEFLECLYTHPKYTVVPIDPLVLKTLYNYSDKMHRDPADQLIVATALSLQGKLMTNDCKIIQSKLVSVL